MLICGVIHHSPAASDQTIIFFLRHCWPTDQARELFNVKWCWQTPRQTIRTFIAVNDANSFTIFFFFCYTSGECSFLQKKIFSNCKWTEMKVNWVCLCVRRHCSFSGKITFSLLQTSLFYSMPLILMKRKNVAAHLQRDDDQVDHYRYYPIFSL